MEAVLDPFPLLPPGLRELLDFTARYYGCGVAHLLPLCLPPAVAADWATATPDGPRLADLRDAGDWAGLARLGERWHRGELAFPALFHRRGLRGAGVTEVRRTALPHPDRVTPAQAKVLLALEDGGGAMLEALLLEAAGVGPSVLAGLERHGLVERVRRLDLLSRRTEDDAPDKRVELNAEQREAVAAVAPGLRRLPAVRHHRQRQDRGLPGTGGADPGRGPAGAVAGAGDRPDPAAAVPAGGALPGPGGGGPRRAQRHRRSRPTCSACCRTTRPLFVGVRNAVLAPLRDIGPDRGGRGAGGLVQERGAPPYPRPGPGREAGPAGGLPGGAGQRHPVPGELARRPAGPLPPAAAHGAARRACGCRP